MYISALALDRVLQTAAPAVVMKIGNVSIVRLGPPSLFELPYPTFSFGGV